MQHNNFKKDIDLLSEAYGRIGTEDQEDRDKDAEFLAKFDRLPESESDYDALEDEEGLNPMRRYNYLLSQLSDMKKDLSLGINADSTIFQEIRHVAEQIATWCDDQQA